MDIQDYQVMEQLIRVCSERGAIRPQEMTTVGVLYNKLCAVIKELTDKKPLPTITEHS